VQPVNDTQPACDDLKSASRRSLLQRSAALASIAMAAPFVVSRLSKSANAQGGGEGTADTLVHVFLRGGMDALTTVVPYADTILYSWRPKLGVRPPGTGSNAALDLDGFFGVAPACAPLLTPYLDGKLAFVHAVGSPDHSRSHFDTMASMEFGIPLQGLGSVNDGWIGRHLQNVPPAGSAAVLRGFAVDYLVPASMLGGPMIVSTPDPPNFDFPGEPGTAGVRRRRVRRMYVQAREPLSSAGVNAIEAIDLINTVDFAGYVPENGASYPNSYFGIYLKYVAAMIKANLGIEVYSVDLHGWDTHAQQGPVDGGYMHLLLSDLSRSLEAFYKDLQACMDRIVVVAESEFGRRVEENVSEGTDHGFAGAMIVMGGHIQGGQVLTDWPGLAAGKLNDGDLDLTFDYRDILAEILQNRMGQTRLDLVFPNYTPQFRGITG